ncbi:vitamin K epoxide reductase family protein [Rhizosphaericola mali]|uniref:Thioredoxin domain-containing protein n=1 Tax=Rhizosphaericola mali TaxID=2545455 RepID=A0A5P2GB49_9BACT|nr:vitamin K epoxide reductase family protein [Rhizosphaericola mali]QES88781.1 thioredoxin domain-containing protein [Rhizosphaericola mali]
MKDLFNNLISPTSNIANITYIFCHELKVTITKTTLQKELEEHPDYPSLLSISDVLKSLGVENFAIKKEIENFSEFPVPFITQLKIGHENLFSVVFNTSNNQIFFWHPIEKKKISLSYGQFNELFSGYILLAEASDMAGETDYAKHLKHEKVSQIKKIISLLSMPLLTIIACVICFVSFEISAFPAVVYTLLALAGTFIGTLLLWYEVDKYNPALQQICSRGKKTNCNAILSSTGSSIFGISWSTIGFTYFAGMLISLLVSGIYNRTNLDILIWLSVLALPYIIFSIYYQAKIAKQWCTLCLTVQAILALQFMCVFFGGYYKTFNITNIHVLNVFIVLLSFTITFLIVSILLPALRSARENKQNKNELQRLKHNPQIFNTLLIKQRSISEPSDGLGISLGHPNAKYKLIKVCNPYCGPCAKAHPAIEELLKNNPDVQVQIIFTASDDEKDIKAYPVKHLLAIAGMNNKQQTKQALDDWYLADKKNYGLFAAKYPMNGELNQQGEKVKAMRQWCNKTEIAFTPTFFLNGYLLPEQYSVTDLKYLLSV